MDFIHNAVRWVTRWTEAHLHQIAVALVTSVIALYAADIKRFIRNRVRKWSFVSRTAVFVLVSGVGFGLLVVLASPQLARLLAHFGGVLTLLVTIGVFVGVGVLAERKGQI